MLCLIFSKQTFFCSFFWFLFFHFSLSFILFILAIEKPESSLTAPLTKRSRESVVAPLVTTRQKKSRVSLRRLPMRVFLMSCANFSWVLEPFGCALAGMSHRLHFTLPLPFFPFLPFFFFYLFLPSSHPLFTIFLLYFYFFTALPSYLFTLFTVLLTFIDCSSHSTLGVRDSMLFDGKIP